MSTKKKTKNNAISLRTIYTLMVVGAVLLAGLMLYSTAYLSSSYRALTENSKNTIELRKASLELMDASDYLTERVHRFVITGDKRLMKEYFNEAFSFKHREEAINTLTSGSDNKEAIDNLSSAMDSSMRLMNREYYAFRLVIEAKGFTDYPEQLKDIKLSDSDKALSPDQQMSRAADIVFDNDYYTQKHLIHDKMQASLDELEKAANEADNKALSDMRSKLTLVRIMILIETIAMFFLVWIASHLGINPIIRAVERIKNNTKIPEVGTREFRYLVSAYNQMYDMYRKSLKHLDFKASHDELTGVYNRAGYDTLISSIELKSTYMLYFDVDNFKYINDTYGHETGDKVLKKLVSVLQNNFRPDDFVCRIGGDEFVVLMVHTDDNQKDLIASKIEEINKQLADSGDGLPCASISVGVVHGSEVSETDELYKKTDEAMYKSKQKGKHTYTFYSSEA